MAITGSPGIIDDWQFFWGLAAAWGTRWG